MWEKARHGAHEKGNTDHEIVPRSELSESQRSHSDSDLSAHGNAECGPHDRARHHGKHCRQFRDEGCNTIMRPQ